MTHQGADAGKQLLNGERFGQIIVRAEVQAIDPVRKPPAPSVR